MIISSEKFVPHSLQHLIDVHVFPTPLPETFYNKTCAEYEQISNAITNRIIYESDGLKVTGISCLPQETQNKKYPIYIYNRGGNREYGKLTVLSVMRSLLPFASKGYLTYASNYRGNDGGEGIDEFGGSDVNDVLNLLEIAKQNPAWDGRNIFMLGHSRGGMMTYLFLSKNQNITAAVSLAGISDIGEHDTSRFKKIMDSLGLTAAEDYKQRSAVCWAEKISTPLLLMHGTSDEAIDPEHSRELDKKLTARHELIIYEGGNHALLRHWPQVLEKSMVWFERYRK